MPELSVIGKRTTRPDGQVKVTGDAAYTADIQLSGMLIGKIKASPHPFARIISIKTDKAKKLTGVLAVITAKDVAQFPFGVYIDDELPLADEYVRYAGDEVAAVAAVDEDTAEEALDLIKVEYETLPYVLDAEKAMQSGAPIIHPERKEIKNNTTYHMDFVRGEGEAAFKQADLILEEKFTTQAVHQAYLEPQVGMARWEFPGKVTLWTSTQHIFTNRLMLARALGIPEGEIRMIQPYVGGGFGGKEELHAYHPIIVFLARATGKPVRIVYSREEDFIAGRPRTSHTIDLRLGFKKDGTMVAKRAVSTINAGAYTGICPLITRVSVTRTDSLYRLPNIHTIANLVYTNTIPRGAFRGFGDPQMLFAMESLIDMAAEKLGIDPVELKLKNAVHKGDTTQHGFVLRSCAYQDTLRLARRESGWVKKRQKKDGYRGIGVACQVHNSGNKSAAKLWGYFGSAAVISVDRNAKVRVVSGEIELGQGMLTIYTQIVAEVLGVPQKDIEIAPCVDSGTSPFGMGTSGSKVTTLGGNAVLLAARDTKRQLFNYAARRIGVKPAQLEIKGGKFYVKGSREEMDSVRDVARDVVMIKQKGAPIIGRGEYEAPDYVVIPDETCYGNFSLGWTFSTAVVEVSVDIDTGKVDVLDVWHALDVGRVLNPGTAEGQVEGGAVQGIGYALTEDYLWEKGILHNANFTDYKLPLPEGTPKIHCLWVEKPNPGGPFGAKAMGEHSLNPIAPAIANAIYNAVGIRIKSLPITPEKILNAIKKNNGLLEEA